MPYEWIVWAVALIACIGLEAATADLVVIWFIPAAVVSLIVSFFPVPFFVQVLVFLAVGIVLLCSTRPLCRKWKRKKSATNADSLIGERGLVTEEIDNRLETGEVKINGLRCSARTENGERVAVGEDVEIMEIRGVKLIVKKINL